MNTMRVVLVVVAAMLASCACSSPGSTHAVATVGASGGVYVVVSGDSTSVTSVPSCRWPLNVSGDASGAQVGLIRCYVRALARRSLNELAPLTRAVPGDLVMLTPAELAHAAAAASGTASATFTINPADPFDASVDIAFADRSRASIGMDALNVTQPASDSWRLDIGTPAPSPLFTGIAPTG